MICFPNAKINLGLHVIDKREDGFHNIETVFYPVPCFDMLEMVRTSGQFSFATGGIPVDAGTEGNLVARAYRLLERDHRLGPVNCFLYKSIPMGAGLGGGSADAAFAIRLLDELFTLKLSDTQLKNYAAQLGSDCAFFIGNQPAYLFGKGHELEPYPINLSAYYIALLYPQVHSSTALAYRDVPKRGTVSDATSLKKILHEPVVTWKEQVHNDFEISVFRAFPQLAQLKQQLYDAGALYASMSGSGSTIFGLFDQEPQLPAALKQFVVYCGKL